MNASRRTLTIAIGVTAIVLVAVILIPLRSWYVSDDVQNDRTAEEQGTTTDNEASGTQSQENGGQSGDGAVATDAPQENTTGEEEPATASTGTVRQDGTARTGSSTPPSAAPSTAAEILARGTLIVGVKHDFKPFGYLDENGDAVGFDIDLAREFARRWLGDADALELVPVTSGDRIERLAAGELDMAIASMTHKRDRDATIDFSQTYFLDGQSMLVNEDSGINGLSDLDGRRVAAIQGATSGDNLNAIATELGLAVELETYAEYPSALEALLNGDVDVLTTDSVALNQFAQDNPGLRVVGGRFTSEPYGIGVPQGDSYFREMVNFTLQDMKLDGTYDALYQKWFPADEPYAVAISPGEWTYSFETMPAEAAASAQKNIQAFLERGRLNVGVRVDQAPFGTTDQNGAPIGFDIDMAREFARRWLGDENAVNFVVGSQDEQIVNVVSHNVDLVAAALVNQRDWSDFIDFSQPYVGPPVTAESYSVGLPQHDSEFRELVDFTLQEMKRDGTYDALHSRWFGSVSPAYTIETLPGDADYLLVTYREAALAPRITEAQQSTIGRIKQRGNVMLAGVKYDFKPFGFLGDSGQVEGFDIDLMRAIADLWAVEVQFVPVTSSNRIDKLVAGEVDVVAASMTHKKERDELIDFGQTYFLDGQSLLVRADSGIDGIQDLDGAFVAAIQGSTSIDQIQAHADANGVSIDILPFQEYPPGLEALKAGQVAALTTDSVALSQFAKDNEDLVVVGGLFTQEPYGFGLPPGDSYFNNLVNFSLQELKKSGVYDDLYRKWFGEASTPYAVLLQPGAWPHTFADSPTTLDSPVQSKVAEIQRDRGFVAGVKYDFKPFGFLNENSELVGFDIDIMREFARRWHGDEDAVEFVPVTSSNRIDKLVAGEVDIVAASMTHKQERDELIDFSQTYFLDGQSLLVRADAGITDVVDLDGKVVAAIRGSTSIDNIRQKADEEGIAIDVLPFQEYPQALEALKAGQVDTLTTDSVALSQFALEDQRLQVVGGRFTSEPYGMGVPNYDDRFQDLVNFTLQEMKLDGTYDRLYGRWFGDGTPYDVEVWPGQSYLEVNTTPMVRIPAGEFVRGSNDGFPDERPQQTVMLDEFYIDQYEVSNRQYDQCVRAGQCTVPRLPRSVNFGRYYAESAFRNYPVIWVDWQDAAAYCAFAGKRLPTEAEWEKTARGSQGAIYPWGDKPPRSEANFNYAERDVAPIGAYAGDVSPFGAADMAGNVREWVSDWYQWDYYQEAPASNPAGPPGGVTRVLRGGGWNDTALYLRSAVRKNFLPDSYDSNLGFRCASSFFPPSW